MEWIWNEIPVLARNRTIQVMGGCRHCPQLFWAQAIVLVTLLPMLLFTSAHSFCIQLSQQRHTIKCSRWALTVSQNWGVGEYQSFLKFSSASASKHAEELLHCTWRVIWIAQFQDSLGSFLDCSWCISMFIEQDGSCSWPCPVVLVTIDSLNVFAQLGRAFEDHSHRQPDCIQFPYSIPYSILYSIFCNCWYRPSFLGWAQPIEVSTGSSPMQNTIKLEIVSWVS